MGHHINKKGQFQSDKYPWLSPNKIILSFNDKIAREVLRLYAEKTKDRELANDIREVIRNIVISKIPTRRKSGVRYAT